MPRSLLRSSSNHLHVSAAPPGRPVNVYKIVWAGAAPQARAAIAANAATAARGRFMLTSYYALARRPVRRPRDFRQQAPDLVIARLLEVRIVESNGVEWLG